MAQTVKHTNTQHVDIVSTFSVTKGKEAKTGDKTRVLITQKISFTGLKQNIIKQPSVTDNSTCRQN